MIFLGLTCVLVAKKAQAVSANVPVSGNAKKSSSQSMGLENTGKKRKNEPQVSTPLATDDDAEQARSMPPPKKKKITPTQVDAEQARASPTPKEKKMKATSVKPSQSSATAIPIERNNRYAQSTINNGAKKRPGDDASINTDPATPARPEKKAKVGNPAALTKAPIRRTGKNFLMLKDTC